MAKLDVDANPMVAQALGVQSIPTVVAFKDGQPVNGFVGAYPEPEVQRFVNELLPSPTDLAAEQAVEEASAGDAERGERDLRAVLADDPDNESARLGLASLLVDRGELAEARELVAPLLPNPEAERILSRVRVAGWSDLGAGDGVEGAKVAAAAGRPREALERLLAAAPADEEAREAMLDLFTVLGDDDPLVPEFRRKLSSALF